MDSINEVQQECMRDSIDWFGETIFKDIVHQALALCGEAGELANIVKKVERGDRELTEEIRLALALECADVFIYTCNIATILNVDLGRTYSQKREFNSERFSGRSAGTEGRVLRTVQQPDGEGS